MYFMHETESTQLVENPSAVCLYRASDDGVMPCTALQ